MQAPKKKLKQEVNRYQVLTILMLMGTVGYGIAFNNTFHSFAADREHRLWINGIMCICFALAAIGNYLLSKKAAQTNQEN